MYPNHNSTDSTTAAERATIREQSLKEHRISVWRPPLRTRVIGKIA